MRPAWSNNKTSFPVSEPTGTVLSSPDSNQEPKTVYFARSKTEASIVKGWLEQEGIQARIFDGSDVAGIFDVIDSDPQIIVDEKDAEAAVKIIKNYQAELQQTPDMANVSDDEGQFDWPLCPVCDELRLATCDKCDVTSNEFSIEGDKVVCLECNDETSLTYMDKCKFCDHDFTGATPDNVALSESSLDATNSNRAILLVCGLLVLFTILAVWFFIFAK